MFLENTELPASVKTHSKQNQETVSSLQSDSLTSIFTALPLFLDEEEE